MHGSSDLAWPLHGMHGMCPSAWRGTHGMHLHVSAYMACALQCVCMACVCTVCIFCMVCTTPVCAHGSERAPAWDAWHACVCMACICNLHAVYVSAWLHAGHMHVSAWHACCVCMACDCNVHAKHVAACLAHALHVYAWPAHLCSWP